jgi:pyrroloquinoline quinone (PQQ) biosynthesis protein C
MVVRAHKNINRIEITPHSGWAQKFWNDLVSHKDQIVHHTYFADLEGGKLSLERARRGLIEFYPLVENFPKYMALNLAKTLSRSNEGHRKAKAWLIQNMKVEQKHADWWCDWAECLDLSREILDQSEPGPMMDAINHYLWNINTNGSLAEGIAATNLAVEWATGEWSIRILTGVRSYANRGLANFSKRTMTWLDAHATYDDVHPYEAMELIKMIAVTPEEQARAFKAARRAMEYYLLALDYCYDPHRFDIKSEKSTQDSVRTNGSSLSV